LIRSLFRRKLRSVGGLHVSYLLLDVTTDKTIKAGSAAAIRQLTSRLRDGEFKQPRTFDLYSATTPRT
jgi:hypothetical protein